MVSLSSRSAKGLANVACMRKSQSGKASHPVDVYDSTVRHFEEMGIHDEGLWYLQELVAAEIVALYYRNQD